MTLEVVSWHGKLGKICKRLGGQLKNFAIWRRHVYQSSSGTWSMKSPNGLITVWWALYFVSWTMLCLTSTPNARNYGILWRRRWRWKKSREKSMTPEANLLCVFAVWTLLYDRWLSLLANRYHPCFRCSRHGHGRHWRPSETCRLFSRFWFSQVWYPFVGSNRQEIEVHWEDTRRPCRPTS